MNAAAAYYLPGAKCYCGQPIRSDRWFWWTSVGAFRYHAKKCRDAATPQREDLERSAGLLGGSQRQRRAARLAAMSALQGACLVNGRQV